MEHLLSRIFSAAIFFALTTSLWGQAKLKRTPYLGKPSLSEVTQIRQRSDETRKLKNFQPTPHSAAITVFEAGIGYCSSSGITDPGFILTPLDADPIRLGDIKNFSLLHMDKQTITLRVGILPTISEVLLLKEQPSYSVLETTYSRTLDITMPQFKKSGRSCIIGKLRDYDETRQIITYLDALVIGRETNFYYDSNIIWWAIPSVIADKTYPLTVTPSAYTGVTSLK